MRIKQFRRKYIILSLILILTGVVISVAGFGVVGFHYNELKNNTIKESWYHTIHINNDNLWYGVDFGNDIHLLNIGSKR